MKEKSQTDFQNVSNVLKDEQIDTNKPLEAWPRCPEAARFFDEQFAAFATANASVATLAVKLHDYAGVDIRTLVDHWIFPQEPEVLVTLRECGLVPSEATNKEAVWEHPAGRLPRVRTSTEIYCPRLAIAVENVSDFVEKHSFDVITRRGDSDSSYEEALCPLPHGELVVVARRGYRGFVPGVTSTLNVAAIAEMQSRFDTRDRSGKESDTIQMALSLFEAAAERLGDERAVDEFFASERRYYMSRNGAARWQYGRQQNLGIGWANHDHHTYRSSRESFRPLMELWSAMGFRARERFYAGADAGWGAQIFEHPVSRVVLFNDVDMLPEELDIDFHATDLKPLRKLGTIGLWCAMHGSSIGAAGMHHLECEFDFAYINTLLTTSGHATMKPFTDLPILKQAFTEPEMWKIDPGRLAALATAGHITPEDAKRFAVNGAAGSHLEVLQRWEGFKGFNKTGISNIIRDTDARHIGAAKARKAA